LPDKDFHPARCIKIKLDALTLSIRGDPLMN
jgi:hypothetical protein